MNNDVVWIVGSFGPSQKIWGGGGGGGGGGHGGPFYFKVFEEFFFKLKVLYHYDEEEGQVLDAPVIFKSTKKNLLLKVLQYDEDVNSLSSSSS